MCKGEPGPRCSNHAQQDYTHALTSFNRESNPKKKELLAAKVEKKKQIFESTPRGQNELKRLIDQTEDEGSKKTLRERLASAVELRTQQQKLLKIKNENKIWDVRQALVESGLNGKTDFSVGIFKNKLVDYLKEQDYSLDINKNYADLYLNNTSYKILILPTKGSITLETVDRPATKFKHSNEDFNLLLNKYDEYSKIDETESKRVYKWFIKHLINQQVTHIALVNIQLETVSMFKLSDSSIWLDVILEAKPKFSGTSFYAGGTKPILYLMKNSPFASGKLVQVENSKRYQIHNMPNMPARDCKIGGYYFKWNGETYDIRKQSKVNKYNLKAKFKATDKVWHPDSDFSVLN